MLHFPQNFLWGAATSSYQVEGGNSNSDWWHWEKKNGLVNSGPACRQYELFAQDFELARSQNHNAHRLSLEWARLEPQEGEFSEQELKHYIEVIDALVSRGKKPVVTLHHFTNPLWLSDSGGWENPAAVKYFLRYCKFVVSALAGRVRFWITINEPLVYIYHSYILGVWPPQKKSVLSAMRAEGHLVAAHIKAYRLIHKLYNDLGLDKPNVSIAKNVQAFVACRDNFLDRLGTILRDYWYNIRIIDKLTRHNAIDFIGLNYYSRQLVEVKNWGIANLIMDTCSLNHHPLKKNSLGWDIYPEGLYNLLICFKKYNLPVIITENGICTDDDGLRWEYIYGHLKQLHQAIGNGVKVAGYLYWSLLDNFEWDKGFTPRFGLNEVNYDTYARTPRDSARKYAEVCKTGAI